ncbi:hypothetical protein PtB15_8B126 [Puccinia triticina]|nr:hypothetical protein PtB15_8B126 [Puccinia triticina]
MTFIIKIKIPASMRKSLNTPAFLQKLNRKRISNSQRSHRRRRSNLNYRRRIKVARLDYTRSMISNNICLVPNLITTRTPKPIDLFPEITAEVQKKLAARKREQKKYQDNRNKLKKRFLKKFGHSTPTKDQLKTINEEIDKILKKPTFDPIIPRKPTPEESKKAAEYVKKNFTLYNHGHVRVFDSTKPNNQKLIADIHFSDMKKMSKAELDELKFLCKFLHEAKMPCMWRNHVGNWMAEVDETF